MSGELGCAQAYSATIHWMGGGQPFGPPVEDGLVEVQWARTLNEVSEAQITVMKVNESPECCAMLGQTAPWMHELSIYRDTDLVWQGPVVRTVESRDRFTIEAMDVFAWLDHIVNTWRMNFTTRAPDELRRGPMPVTRIAEVILYLSLIKSSLSIPADWANIANHVVFQHTEQNITFEKDGGDDRAIWCQYVGIILRELTGRGLTFTTVGRNIFFRGKATSKRPAIARLTPEDLTGDIQIIRDGHSTATASFATNQTDQRLSGTQREIVGEFGTEYGRLDHLVQITDDSADGSTTPPDEIQERLLTAARNDVAGRYPTPIALNIPDNSQVSPQAPVQLRELVCGERIDMVADTYCTPIGQGFVLTDVVGQWQGGQEQISISLTPLMDPYGKPTDPDDDKQSPVPLVGLAGLQEGSAAA